MRFPNFSHERALYARGFSVVAGTDEAGTGALAGPVVAGAAIVPLGSRMSGLCDSKLLTPTRRKALLREMSGHGIVYASGIVSVEEIAEMNMRTVATLAMARAIQGLEVRPQAVVSDAFRIPGLALEQVPVIRGDRISKSVAAASIVAKVTRDAIMNRLDEEYPGYGFMVHKGYGTASHLEALFRLGPSLIHRMTFAPVKRAAHVDLDAHF